MAAVISIFPGSSCVTRKNKRARKKAKKIFKEKKEKKHVEAPLTHWFRLSSPGAAAAAAAAV